MVECEFCEKEFDSDKELHIHWMEEHEDDYACEHSAHDEQLFGLPDDFVAFLTPEEEAVEWDAQASEVSDSSSHTAQPSSCHMQVCSSNSPFPLFSFVCTYHPHTGHRKGIFGVFGQAV